MVAVVLFFGTLSPEVEKKRKRALEKRERLLAIRRANRERKAALVVAAAAGAPLELPGLAALRGQAGPEGNGGSGASTPGVFEADDRSLSLDGAAPAPANADAGPSTTVVPPASNDTTPTAEPTPTPIAQPAGRTVINDAELFADGLGEPDQMLGELAEQEAAVAEGQVDDTETDDEDDARRDQDEREQEGDVDQIVALF